MADVAVEQPVQDVDGSSHPYRSNIIPSRVGIGLRAPHYEKVLQDIPSISWLEIHSENFFNKGGTSIEYLTSIREHYPLSFHGVGLSLGSADSLCINHLTQLKNLVTQFEPGLVSEHISWSNADDMVANDLLPIPYTEEALFTICEHISQTQDVLGQQILVENPSTYLQFNCSTIPEYEFLTEITRRTGCGILLDINNIYVSCVNHGWDSRYYLNHIPVDVVKEIHLAGHTSETINGHRILIDTHGSQVTPEVWHLYFLAVEQFGHIPTLIEWDNNIPPLHTLLEEAKKAEHIMFSQQLEVV